MSRAGDRDQRIDFDKRIETPLGGGTSAISFVFEFYDFAKAEQSGEMSCRFTMKRRDGIEPTSHRIRWRGRIWTIQSAIYDYRSDSMTIDSTFDRLIEMTHLQSMKTEYVDDLPVVRPRE